MVAKNDPPKDHSHYSQKTQDALFAFQSLWTSYSNLTWLQLRENAMRADAIQHAWDTLARARKEETGSGFYLSKQQYQKAKRK
jgi:hypothetical protein